MLNSSIGWRLANSYGIWMGKAWDPTYGETIADPWNSGHVNDVLVIESGRLIVATDTSGVWLVPGDGSPAICLSNSWPYATFHSVTSGIYPGQIYAGGEALYAINLSSPFPLLDWFQIPLSDDMGTIQRVVVLSDRIVLACDSGMFWALIPAPFSTAYIWMKAEVHDGTGGIVTSGGFHDAAPGVRRVTQTPRGMIVSQEIMAGGLGGDCAGLFWGHWDDAGMLTLERASLLLSIGVADSFEDDLAAVSVASCESDRRQAYALCAKPAAGDTPHFAFVARSTDGGRSWEERGYKVEMETPYSLAQLAGHQGNYTNCIAVARWDPDLVAFGMTIAFISFDGGWSWHPQGINSQNKYVGPRHLHVDIHGLTFTDSFPGAPQSLYIASDGGIATVTWGAGPWMIESDHQSDGAHGDFEVLVLEDNALTHYTRPSDNLDAWFKPVAIVSTQATGGACMIVSDYSTGDRQDYDAVVLEGDSLAHYWADNSTSPPTWHRVQAISNLATGPGCIIQSDFVTYGHKHFEVVVQEGSNLVHYWHEGPDRSGPWHQTPTPITTHAASAGCFMQGTFGSGSHGNFELVVLEDGSGSQGAGIVHYWRDNSGSPYPWYGPTMIDRNASAQGCLFQTDLGSNDFSLVVQTSRELVEWRRDNSGYPYPWRFAQTIMDAANGYKATGPACAFQGSYRLGSDHGNFEMAASKDGNVVYSYRQPDWAEWYLGPSISNKARTYASVWNRQLPILQFYGPSGTGYSTLGVSSLFPGTVGSGSQDNGVLYTTADHSQPGQPITPWFELEGGDGGAAAFLASHSLLGALPATGHVFIEYTNDEDSEAQPIGVKSCYWDGAHLIKYPAANPVIPLGRVNPTTVPAPASKRGLIRPRPMEVVTEPEYPGNLEYKRRGLLCAVGVAESDVYGLFVSNSADANTLSPPRRWDYIGTAMDAAGVALGISALASRDGFTIVIGTQPLVKKLGTTTLRHGQIYRMDSDTGNLSIMGTDPPLNSPLVTAIVVISHNEAYATANTGQVIRWDGVLWRATATLPPDAGDLQAITSDLSVTPPVIFVAAERHVYVTADRGATWQGASNGLPAAVLCSDIRWVQDNDGARVYLSTYGRSVWVAEQTVGK